MACTPAARLLVPRLPLLAPSARALLPRRQSLPATHRHPRSRPQTTASAPAATDTGTGSKALEGILVLDLSRVLAGPLCTQNLADLGANVIKVERPPGGDETRAWGPPFTGPFSTYFCSVNRNKRSLALDLKTAAGRQTLLELAAKADVLVENFVPGTMEKKLGLGYEQVLQPLNPSLIYCSITGFGPDGPYRERAGLDVIVSAIGGLMGITGPEAGASSDSAAAADPVKVGVAVTDIMTGLNAQAAILAALHARAADPQRRGQRLDCSLLESQVAALVNVGSAYLNAGLQARPMGTAHASICPYQAFATADGHVLVGAANDAQFRRLCKHMSCPQLAEDPRFATNPLRVEHRQALIAELNHIFSTASTAVWLERLEPAGIPFGPVNSIAQVFADPQVLHRGMVQTCRHPQAGELKLIGPAVKYSRTPAQITRPPPLLNEHGDEILRELLGYSDAQLQALKDAQSE